MDDQSPSESPALETPLSKVIDQPITWRTIIRAGLVWAAEYAMLALIEDASAALKIATMLCALAGLVILESENWLRRRNNHFFVGSIEVIAFIYLGFVYYAVDHAVTRQENESGLRDIYISASYLINRQMPASDPGSEGYDKKAVDQLENDANDWRQKTANWLGTHLGSAARERFLEVRDMPALCWGPKDREMICDLHYGGILNRLVNDKKNLSAILESGAYTK